jgi:hypothetical protein
MSDSNSNSNSITVTLVDAVSGQSESLPVPSTTTVQELCEWSKGIFGLSGDNVQLYKDGAVLQPPTASLLEAGIRHGDLVATRAASAPASSMSASASAAPLRPVPSARATTAAQTAPAAAGGGLDFSSLLLQGGGGGGGGTINAAAPSAQQQQQQLQQKPPDPIYYAGMHLNDAMGYNPHPHAFCTLVLTKEHLFKELNYHSPRLAEKIKGQPLDKAVQIWRGEMVKGGIQQAVQASTKFHQENTMKEKLHQNPNDSEARAYFNNQERQTLVDTQYRQMKEEYPEALGRVLMLYVDTKINDHPIQAFCDSGAQSTIMSKKIAEQCGLSDYIDTRFEGTAVGVGTGKILGRIHMVQLQIGDYYFPCSVTVMDDPAPGASEMPFLFGLDMMKRHTCQIDLERGCLKFRLAPGEYMETPFLHEKDLDESKGGTQGFNAEKANQELVDLDRKREAQEDDKKGDDKMDSS